MRGFAARATVANMVREGYVLDNSHLRRILSQFGMDTANCAIWDFYIRYVYNDGLKRASGVDIGKFDGGFYYDRGRYASGEAAYGKYQDQWRTTHEVLDDMFGFRRAS